MSWQQQWLKQGFELEMILSGLKSQRALALGDLDGGDEDNGGMGMVGVEQPSLFP